MFKFIYIEAVSNDAGLTMNVSLGGGACSPRKGDELIHAI